MGEVFYNQIGTDGCEEKFYDWKMYCCKFLLILSPSAANEKFNSIGSAAACGTEIFFCTSSTIIFCHSTNHVSDLQLCRCRWHQKPDWLNGEKLSWWTCSTHFSTIPWRSLSKDNVKFSSQSKERTLRRFRTTWQTRNNRGTLNLSQVKWSFCCSSRRSSYIGELKQSRRRRKRECDLKM